MFIGRGAVTVILSFLFTQAEGRSIEYIPHKDHA